MNPKLNNLDDLAKNKADFYKVCKITFPFLDCVKIR